MKKSASPATDTTAHGIRCPVCGLGDTEVTDSQLLKNGSRRRYRRCSNGHSFRTHEFVYGALVGTNPITPRRGRKDYVNLERTVEIARRYAAGQAPQTIADALGIERHVVYGAIAAAKQTPGVRLIFPDPRTPNGAR
jgi:hypothetical protein